MSEQPRSSLPIFANDTIFFSMKLFWIGLDLFGTGRSVLANG
jgi:hypothetical protein